jgi:hypothetical protein
MHITRVTLALLAGQVSLALATPLEQFVLQEPNAPLASSGGFCDGSSSADARLDNGIFTGYCQDKTAVFLGIPYAQPP